MNTPTDTIRELLDAAAHQPAQLVRIDPDVAWAAGARRRLRARLVAGATTVAALAAALGGVQIAADQPAPADAPAGVAQFPARLDYPYWDLDDRGTGLVAGVVYRNNERTSGWFTVSPGGHLRRLDIAGDHVPTLSPDGTRLGYMRGSTVDGTYAIADRVRGTSVSFPQIGTGVFNARVEDHDRDHPYYHSGQSPAFWSPDGDRLVLGVGLNAQNGPEPAVALLGADGSFETIPEPAGSGHSSNPVGWLDNDHIALVGGTRAAGPTAMVWIINVRTEATVRSFPLAGVDARRDLSQWFGSLSPDGNTLATTHLGRNVTLFAMHGPNAGHPREQLPHHPAHADFCALSWSTADVHLPGGTHPDEASFILYRADGKPTILTDPRLGVACSSWARTALDGGPDHSLGGLIFGQSTSWLSWHWRELIVTGAVILIMLTPLQVARRRRAASPRN